MKLNILHLSDVHIRVGHEMNPILKRVDDIGSAFYSITPDATNCIIVVSGDIAFSGNRDEYTIASQFMRTLDEAIAERLPNCVCKWILIPGNHDCDFSHPDNVRELILREVHADEITDDMLSTILNPQKEYWKFIEDNGLAFSTTDSMNRVFSKHEIDINGNRLEFRLINTAIFSRKKEIQGSLLFPIELFDPQNENERPSSIVFTVMHHPYNWFEESNARSLRLAIESTSDVIITGHEHEEDQYFKIRISGEQTEYIEGSKLQDLNDTHSSGFNILVIDIGDQTQLLYQFNWSRSNNRYEVPEESLPFPFVRNSYRLRNEYQVAQDFQDVLQDPGANFTHHAIDKISLADIFVYPDIRCLDLTGSEALGTQVVREQLTSFLIDEKHVLLFGPDRCGKTTLGKVLFQELRKNAFVPLMIEGETIRRPVENHLDNVIQRTYKTQYSTPDETEFNQLEKSKKAIIVDDFHRIPVNSRGRNRITEYLETRFEVVVLLSGEYFRFDDILDRSHDDLTLWQFTTCEILPFGHLRRSDLIRRWYFMGRELTHDEFELRRESLLAERLITELIGKNLTPSYPLFILILLQQIEAQAPLETTTASGSYGYLYESLLTIALFKAAGRDLDLDTQYNYLSELAFYQFVNHSRSMELSDALDWHQDFSARYSRRLDFNNLVPGFVSAGVLSEKNERIEFKYPYLYYYFVARYFRDHLHESGIRDYVNLMSSRLHHTESVNILIFLSYLSKDPLILDSILSASKSLFSSDQEADILEDTGFLTSIIDEIPELTLDTEDPEDRRRRLLATRDDRDGLDESITQELPSDDLSRVETDSNLEKVLQINVAFKAIQILGQILRNYPGSLLREQKLDLAAEAYSLGLRTLSFMYDSVESNQERIIEFLADLLRDSFPEWPDDRIKDHLGLLVFSMIEGVTLLALTQISDAVGMEDLSMTFDELVDTNSNDSYKYIDISIRLFHFRSFPEDKIFKIFADIRKNPFGSQVLKKLVWHYFYIFPAKHELVQSVCDRLGITLKPPQLYDPRSRMLPG